MTMIDVDRQSEFESPTGGANPGDAQTRTHEDAELEGRAGDATRAGAGAEPARGPDQGQSGGQGRSVDSNQVQSQSDSDGQGPAQPQKASQVTGETAEAAPAGQRNLEEELESLRAEAAAWREKAEFNWDQFLRARADLDNYRKRVERDLAFRIRQGKKELILGFLEVLDNLERVLQAGKAFGEGLPLGAEQTTQQRSQAEQGSPKEGFGNASAFFAGVEMIKRQVEALLRAEGVVPVDCLGKPFDPSLAEAVEVVEAEAEPGTVVEVILKGYTYEGDLLRPARVKVAK
ncbi:MAG: nucleotide exchange factor GrpE [Firmicutes bacterium]|nr:nucleotide exchange factor GrpE [Candidatus Fermentithermobacillaceae bacterium]